MPDRVTAGIARRCFFGVEVVTVTQQPHQPAPSEQSGRARRNGKDRPAREPGEAGLVRHGRLAGISARTNVAKGQAGAVADLNADLGQRGHRMPAIGDAQRALRHLPGSQWRQVVPVRASTRGAEPGRP